MFTGLFTIDRDYEYFDELRDDASGWELDFRQTGTARAGHKLLQLVAPDFGLVSCAFNSAYDQRSASPRNLRTFSILADRGAASSWCGQKFEWNTLVSFTRGDEFRALSTGFFSNYVFSLPEALLACTAEHQFHTDWASLDRAFKNGMVRLGDDDINDLRALLARGVGVARSEIVFVEYQGFVAQLAELLLKGLLRAGGNCCARGTRNRRQYFLAAQDYIDANIENPLGKTDLCDALGVSARTLDYAFLEQGGLSPKAYVNCQRLSRVHTALVECSRGETSVAEIANQWGFWHMGQFARDYRKVYGVNPSETMVRQTRCVTDG